MSRVRESRHIMGRVVITVATLNYIHEEVMSHMSESRPTLNKCRESCHVCGGHLTSWAVSLLPLLTLRNRMATMSIKAYGVATISRLLKIIGLFCRIQSLL